MLWVELPLFDIPAFCTQAEEFRKLKGLEREPDEETAKLLQQMSAKLLETEAELVQKEVSLSSSIYLRLISHY